MFLLDTNVVSEIRRGEAGRADENVMAWAESVETAQTFVSAVTVYELERGSLLLERRDPRQGRVLRDWLALALLPHFAGRILPFDARAAAAAARMTVPDPRPLADVMIAATAEAANLTVVTRNRRDFEVLGVPVLNPWDDRG